MFFFENRSSRITHQNDSYWWIDSMFLHYSVVSSFWIGRNNSFCNSATSCVAMWPVDLSWSIRIREISLPVSFWERYGYGLENSLEREISKSFQFNYSYFLLLLPADFNPHSLTHQNYITLKFDCPQIVKLAWEVRIEQQIICMRKKSKRIKWRSWYRAKNASMHW